MWNILLSNILWIVEHFWHGLMDGKFGPSVHDFDPNWNISIAVGWIAVTCDTDHESPEDESHWRWWLIDLFSKATRRFTLVFFSSLHLLDGLPWNLVQVKSRMYCNNYWKVPSGRDLAGIKLGTGWKQAGRHQAGRGNFRWLHQDVNFSM